MSAVLKLPDNIVPFDIPKRKPKVIQKEEVPYQKSYCILPWRAVADRRLHEGTLRVLAAIASYSNRAGITWVGQTTIGKHLGITKQAVSKQYKLLIKLGYIEVMSKGWRGERANTTRIIFDESVSAEDSIAVTSSVEDTRPPYLVKKEMNEMTKAKAQAEFKKAMSQLTGKGKSVLSIDTVVKPTDSILTKEMKEKIKAKQDQVKASSKRNKDVVKPVDNPVDNHVVKSLHSQPHSQPLGVDQLSKEGNGNKLVVNNNKELINKNIKIFKELVWSTYKIERTMNEQDLTTMTELVEAGLTEELWTDVVTDILATMKEKRHEPPHRIGFFKEGLMKVLNSPTA